MDALVNFFTRKYPSNFVAGIDDSNIIIIQNTAAKNNQFLLLLAVGIAYDPTHCDVFTMHNYIMHKFEVDACFKQLYNLARNMHAKSSISMEVVVYPSLPEYAENYWCGSERQYPFGDIKFYLHGDGTNSRVITGSALRQYIYDAVQCHDTKTGTSKEQNKRISGYMQYWNRQYLSPSLVVADIDGAFYNSDKDITVLLEVKRSNIVPWHPYLEDLANYRLYHKLSRNLNPDSSYFVIQHRKPSGAILYDTSTTVKFYSTNALDEDVITRLTRYNKPAGDFLLHHNQPQKGEVLTLADICQAINAILEL